jgi:chromosome segregation ATPase
MLATVDIATARFPVENWNKQLDAAKGRVEEARRALPAEEGNLLQLDYELQLAKREESRLQGELDKLQELIDTTTRSIDDSAINDGPHEFPAAMRTVSGRPVGSPT